MAETRGLSTSAQANLASNSAEPEHLTWPFALSILKNDSCLATSKVNAFSGKKNTRLSVAFSKAYLNIFRLIVQDCLECANKTALSKSIFVLQLSRHFFRTVEFVRDEYDRS